MILVRRGSKAARMFNISQLDILPVKAIQTARETVKDPLLAKKFLKYTCPNHISKGERRLELKKLSDVETESTRLRQGVLEELNNTHWYCEDESTCTRSCLVGMN